MTPPNESFARPPRPRAATPAERGAELAEVQRRLKREAAERREAASRVSDPRRPRPSSAGRKG